MRRMKRQVAPAGSSLHVQKASALSKVAFYVLEVTLNV